MARMCFFLKVKRELLDEYLAAHAKVWPEMLQAMHDAGIRNYSMFHREDGLLVGYLEADDIAKALARSAKTEVSKRWQQGMARFFEPATDGFLPGQPQVLREYFYAN